MKIVILDGYTSNPGDVSWAPLEALGELTVYDRTAPEDIVARAQDAEAVIVNRAALPRAVLEQLPKLKWIGLLATGYNAIDIEAARERNIDVCNVPSYCGDMVAQQALTLLLHLCGNAWVYSPLVRAGRWNEAVEESHGAHPLTELCDKTLGIVGFGTIGQKMAGIGRALGMRVLLSSRTQKPCPPGCAWVDLDTLFAQSDAVSLHCPLTPQTQHLVDARRLALMKPTAFLINTSRGGVVDSRALADALNSGRLAGAGLDVLEQEPPAPDDPLLTAKNCVISPHIAWASKEARIRLIAAVADNLKGFLTGHPQNVVNP